MAEKRGGEVNRLILKKAVSKRVDQIKKRSFISEKEVYDVIRSFFKKFLQIEYEFTKNELIRELKKIYITKELQERIENLYSNISEVEHISRAFSRDELIKVLDEFRVVVEALIIAHYQQERNFLQNIGDHIHRAFSKEHNSVLQNESEALGEDQQTAIRMNMLLDDIKRWSDTDLKKCKVAYQELMKLYGTLSEEKKSAFYGPIQELYNIIRMKL